MDKTLIDTCIARHSYEYINAMCKNNYSTAKYHYGVIVGFLAALLATEYITAKEHMELYSEYINFGRVN